MDSSVIKKLADIDMAARKVIVDAGEEQKKLAQSYRQQTETYDQQVEKDYEQQLEKIRSDLEKENTAEIEKLKADMEKSLTVLEKDYAAKVDSRADEIVARILEAKEI